MRVLAIQSSPRRKGSTDHLLSLFVEALRQAGGTTRVVDICRKNIQYCRGCGYCETHGVCVTRNDDMAREMYGLLREADVIVAATPIYFYHASAQMKTFIDRCQTLWSRKYRLRVKDPGSRIRSGFYLSQAATKGANLFEGLDVTMRYFFDAVDAKYCGGMTYRSIENPVDYSSIPNILESLQKKAEQLLAPYSNRRRLLFISRQNAGRSQVASAFARFYGGDRVDAVSSGSKPAEVVHPMLETVLAEKGIDAAFCMPRSIEAATSGQAPDILVTMGKENAVSIDTAGERIHWDLPDPAGKEPDVMRSIRDQVEKKVLQLLERITV